MASLNCSPRFTDAGTLDSAEDTAAVALNLPSFNWSITGGGRAAQKRRALDVWSRQLLERVKSESFGLDCPSLADELKGCEAPEGFEPSGEVLGVDEVAQVGSQLIVGFIEVAFDGGVLDGAVHPLELAIRPGVLGFG